MKKLATFGLSLLLIWLAPIRESRPTGVSVTLDTTPYIALTFDDGPRRDTTVRLLEGLAQRGVQATFFLIGEQIPGQEDIIRQMALAGHQIGSHTYHHTMLSGSTETEIYYQIQETNRCLYSVLEIEGDWWLRPPYGLISPREAAWIDVPMVQWTVDPEDWKNRNATYITEHLVKTVKPGDIILLHDIYPTSVDGALAAIDALQARGYVFVTVQELFEVAGVIPQAGMLYMNPQKPMWAT